MESLAMFLNNLPFLIMTIFVLYIVYLFVRLVRAVEKIAAKLNGEN